MGRNIPGRATISVPAAAEPVSTDLGQGSGLLHLPTMSRHIRSIGEPNDTVAFCPRRRTVPYPMRWYRLASEEWFHVCTICFANHIHETVLAPFFELVSVSGGRCRLHNTRPLQLCQAIVNSNGSEHDFALMQQYLQSNRNIRDCNGFLTIKAWGCQIETPYETQHSIECCESCYHNHVVGSPAEVSFSRLPYPSLLDRRPCHFSIPLVRRAFDKAASQDQEQSDGSTTAYDWSDFARDVFHRANLLPCTEAGKPTWQATGKWYKVLAATGDVAICETCFLDNAALTRFQSRFVEIEKDARQLANRPQGESFQGFLSRVRRDVGFDKLCVLSLPAGQAAWEAAVNTGIFLTFSRAAATIANGVRCQENGVMPIDGEAYVAGGRDPAINFCPACYAGHFGTCGIAIYFELVRPKPGERLPPCALHPSSKDAAGYAAKVHQVIDEGVLTCFSQFVRERTQFARPCPRDEMIQNRPWYGFLDLTICPRCYESEVVGSTLQNTLILGGQVIPTATMCCLYSPRMRSLWKTACQDGHARGIRAISRERSQTREYVLTNMNRCWDRINARNLIGAMQGMTSSIYSFADGLNAPHGGKQYGSSSLGWHNSRLGAQSAALGQQQSNTMSSANFNFDFQLLQQLETMWKEVE